MNLAEMYQSCPASTARSLRYGPSHICTRLKYADLCSWLARLRSWHRVWPSRARVARRRRGRRHRQCGCCRRARCWPSSGRCSGSAFLHPPSLVRPLLPTSRHPPRLTSITKSHKLPEMQLIHLICNVFVRMHTNSRVLAPKNSICDSGPSLSRGPYLLPMQCGHLTAL